LKVKGRLKKREGQLLSDNCINMGYMLNRRHLVKRRFNLLDCPNVCQVRIVFLNKINQKLSVRLDIAGRLKRSDDLLLKLRWKYQKFPELNVCNCM